MTFTAAGDVRVVITLPMLVGAFALGEPVTAAGVVRGVLALAGSCKNLSGYSNKARCKLNEELDAYLSQAGATEEGQLGWMDKLDAHVAAVDSDGDVQGHMPASRDASETLSTRMVVGAGGTGGHGHPHVGRPTQTPRRGRTPKPHLARGAGDEVEPRTRRRHP